MQPLRKGFGSLARVTSDATPSDVLARDDTGVVDDVLPRRPVPSIRTLSVELNATVNALAITFDDFTFQRIWNVPTIHFRNLGGMLSGPFDAVNGAENRRLVDRAVRRLVMAINTGEPVLRNAGNEDSRLVVIVFRAVVALVLELLRRRQRDRRQSRWKLFRFRH